MKAGGVAALGAGGLPVLAGCGDGGGGDSSSNTLTYISGDTADAERAVYDAWRQDFSRETGKSVTGQHLSYGTDFLTKLQAQIAAGRPPDLIPRWFSDEARSYAGRDQLAPVDDLMDALGATAKWDESSLSRFRVDDRYVGIPLDVTVFPFFWRRDLLDSANLAVPNTWDELLTAAEALTADGVYGTILPFGRSTQASYYLWIMLWTNGGLVVDEGLNVALDSQPVVDTLEFLRQLARFTPPGSGQFGWAENLSTFVNGTCASVLYQGRVLGAITAKNPSIADSLAVGPVPYGREKATLGLWSGSSITAGSKNVQTAEELVRFIHKAENYARWLNLAPGHYWAADINMRSNGLVTNDKLRQKYQDTITQIQGMTSFARSFSQETAEHKLNPRATAILNSNVLADMLQMVLIKKDSPSAAAKWGAQQTKALMEA